MSYTRGRQNGGLKEEVVTFLRRKLSQNKEENSRINSENSKLMEALTQKVVLM